MREGSRTSIAVFKKDANPHRHPCLQMLDRTPMTCLLNREKGGGSSRQERKPGIEKSEVGTFTPGDLLEKHRDGQPRVMLDDSEYRRVSSIEKVPGCCNRSRKEGKRKSRARSQNGCYLSPKENAIL